MQELAPFRSLPRTMESFGWSVLSVEVDSIERTLRVELRNGDRLATFDARNGRATATHERVENYLAPVGRKGDRFLAERIAVRFVRRDRFDGIRSGLRSFCLSIAEGSGAARSEILDSFRPLLTYALA